MANPHRPFMKARHACLYSCLFVGSVLLSACAAERVSRPLRIDPTSAQAAESPAPRPPMLNAPDPLLLIVPEPFPDTQTQPMDPHMHGMNHAQPPPASDVQPAAAYNCTMHPEVRSDQPGHCPKCGMKLVPVQDKSGVTP